MLADARPQHVRAAAVGRSEGARGPGVLRHRQPRRHAVRGRSAPGPAPQPGQGAASSGFTFYVAPDLEFFYFAAGATGQPPQPARRGLVLRPDDQRRRRHRCASRPSGRWRRWASRSSTRFHEDAPSQHEIDLRHTDALTMADSVMTFRLVVKEVAASEGVHATFMPKPLEGVQGSGMHTHVSLFDGDENAFYDAERPVPPVDGRPSGFMAGLLHHAAEITADHQPDGQLLQAARARLRGAGPRARGPATTAPASSGCRSPSGQAERRPASSTARRTRPATPTSPSRVILAAGLKGVEEELRPAAGGRGQPVRD